METSNAIFHSQWYTDFKFAKTYVQAIIQRSQKPIIFTAGGVIVINKATFTSVIYFLILFKDKIRIKHFFDLFQILKSTFSLYTFLNDVRDDK